MIVAVTAAVLQWFKGRWINLWYTIAFKIPIEIGISAFFHSIVHKPLRCILQTYWDPAVPEEMQEWNQPLTATTANMWLSYSCSAVSKCVDVKAFIELTCFLLRSSVPLHHDLCIDDTRLKKYLNKNLCCWWLIVLQLQKFFSHHYLCHSSHTFLLFLGNQQNCLIIPLLYR